jgi:phage tail sheath protein FI
MAFQVSPGVEVKEIDATNVIPAVSTSIGGSVGFFAKGPVNTPITVSSEKQLVETFGEPTAETFKYHGPMAGFLKYGNALKVIRVVDSDTAKNSAGGTAEITNRLIVDKDAYDPLTLALSDGDFIARSTGVQGDALEVQVCLANATSFAAWTYASSFARAPGSSNFANVIRAGVSPAVPCLDEMHVVVIDRTGAISGVPGTILETFEALSQGTNAKNDDGSSNYFKDVINNGSQYIYVGYTGAVGGTWLGSNASAPIAITQESAAFIAAAVTGPQSTSGLNMTFGGGADGTVGGKDDILSGFDLLKDSDTLDVNLLFACADIKTESDIAAKLQEVAEHRKDCVAFVSPPVALTDGSTAAITAATIASDATLAGRNSSYVVLDSTAIKVYDKYTDSYRFINASGHIAGLCANTDRVADAWFSPAGETRGQLLGVTKLGFNPNKADRDTLYKASVNPLVSFPGQGTMLFGDKTSQFRASAFDRINVRRLFIVLEKAISTASKSMLFEFNDEFTRANFRNMVEPFLREVKGRRGITDFLVICDETNNTGNVIDSNQFVADIYIKPARSINFITLNFIATRTGVEFSEIAGQ